MYNSDMKRSGKKQTPSASKRSSKQHAENQFGMILEDINGKIDLLSEGQKSFEQRLTNGQKSFEQRLTKKVEEVRDGLIEFKKDTASNFKFISRHLSKLDDELVLIKKELADIKKTLTHKAEIPRVVALEERVAKLERQLAHA